MVIDDCEEEARTRSNHSVPPLAIINHNSSIILRKKPSAHGQSEIVPAMNRLLTPAGNVRSDGGQPRDGTAPSSFAPEPPLFFSVFSTPSGRFLGFLHFWGGQLPIFAVDNGGCSWYPHRFFGLRSHGWRFSRGREEGRIAAGGCGRYTEWGLIWWNEVRVPGHMVPETKAGDLAEILGVPLELGRLGLGPAPQNSAKSALRAPLPPGARTRACLRSIFTVLLTLSPCSRAFFSIRASSESSRS